MKLSFITPTQVDLRELFTLGLGSKRGDGTKIGHKGSGMKFTLALLHRLGSSLTVTVAGETWVSEVNAITVRGNVHEFIVLRNSQHEIKETNITANAGADTWTHPWFALRELLQNCIDEGGTYGDGDLNAAPEGTIMSITLTPELHHAWTERSNWYRPNTSESFFYPQDGIEPGLFYHGFRISTESGTWKYAYAVTSLINRENLSEDRQARNVNNNDLFSRLVRDALVLPPQVYIDMVNPKPSDDLMYMMHAIYVQCDIKVQEYGGFKMRLLEEAFINTHGADTCYGVNVSERAQYYADGAGVKVVLISYELERILRYSKVLRSCDQLIPALAARLNPIRPSELDLELKTRIRNALRITASLRPKDCEVVMIEPRKDDGVTCAMAMMEDNKVFVVHSWALGATLTQLVEMFVEEFMHLRSQSGDGTIDFEKALITEIASRMMPRIKSNSKAREFSL